MKLLKILSVISLTFLLGCDKEYLEEKPDKGLLVPASLKDFQSLLDNSSSIFNTEPGLTVISSDDFYTTPQGLQSFGTVYERNSYLWLEEIFEGRSVSDWNRPYQQVFYSNIVLEGLEKIKGTGNKSEWNRIKGSALFYRAYAFYHLAQLFAQPYDDVNANTVPGIPLRLTADVNAKPGRGNLQETYSRILGDLTEAALLLQAEGQFSTRPKKAAAFGMLGRVYQTMENYEKAGLYADSCLQLQNQLLDYNTLNPGAARPFPLALPLTTNSEIIFYSTLLAYSFNSSALTFADPILYSSYNSNDLRKVMFFKSPVNGAVNFKGSYSGQSSLAGGINVNEMYLIRAESYARAGKHTEAMNDLNTLLQKRWKAGTFTTYSASTADEALLLVLTERRKELVGRGLRWTDLRRLNKDSRFAVTLTRTDGTKSYSLSPNDKKYVLPIPDNEILNNNIQQNPR